VRHLSGRRRRGLDAREAHRSNARRRVQLDALDLDVFALTSTVEHVIERVSCISQRVRSVRDDDCCLKLHSHSIRPAARVAKQEPDVVSAQLSAEGGGAAWSMARAAASALSSGSPAFAATQQATGAATRSELCAASAASSRIASNSSRVGATVPKLSAYAEIQLFASNSPSSLSPIQHARTPCCLAMRTRPRANRSA
jgi:hypothetical protein